MSSTIANQAASQGAKMLNKGAQRDPELYILGAIMSVAFGGVGYYLGSKPTSATSEIKVHSSAHPGGPDPREPHPSAPSALHSVVVPKVNLPKELHEKYNKWGKEGF